MSLAESLYAAQRDRSRSSAVASARTASAFAGPCSGSPTKPAGVDAVDGLRDRAERARQAEPPGDDRGGLQRRGGHQPDPLPGVEVRLGHGAGARPDLPGHVLVVDLLADGHQFLDAVALDDGQRAVPGVLHVRRVLGAREPEVRLLPGESEQVPLVEELPLVQAAAEVEERGALHHGVVEVEEGGGARVMRPPGTAVRPGLPRLRRVRPPVRSPARGRS